MQIKNTLKAGQVELDNLRRKTELDYLQRELKADSKDRISKKQVLRYITKLSYQWQDIEKMFKEHITKLQKEKDLLIKKIESNCPEDILITKKELEEKIEENKKLKVLNATIKRDLEVSIKVSNDATKQFDDQLKINKEQNLKLENQGALLNKLKKEKAELEIKSIELSKKLTLINTQIQVLNRERSLLNDELKKEKTKISSLKDANKMLQEINLKMNDLNDAMQSVL